jgi:Icc-related predicted phosphoesterase
MTRIVFISDTHGSHHDIKDIPESDIIIHSGDFSSYGHQEDTKDFLKWYHALPHRRKVLVAGNHDKLPFERPRLFKEMLRVLAPSVSHLEDSEVDLEGYTIWGAPWTPRFLDWYFMADRGSAIKAHWDKIPANIDILVTHGPAFGYLDLSNNWNQATGSKFTDHLGCADLRDAIYRTHPLVHCFGHIHGSGGQTEECIDDAKKTIMVNASLMDEDYQLTHKPIVIEL